VALTSGPLLKRNLVVHVAALAGGRHGRLLLARRGLGSAGAATLRYWPALTLVAGFELGGGWFWNCVLKRLQQFEVTLSPKIRR
jgi:hypothetical protein